MRHRCQVKHFGRTTGPRKAMLRSLVDALVEHGRIRTTLPKAKELRRHVEKAVTTGSSGSLNAYRTLLSKYPNKDTVAKIIHDIGPRFKERPGGYTRILKLSPRPGDKAPMAFIEFVDFDPAKDKTKETFKVKVRGADRKLTTKEISFDEKVVMTERTSAKRVWEKKKSVRKMQQASRKINRK